MKQLFRLSLMGLLGAATLSVGAIALPTPAALAQTPRIIEELELTEAQQAEFQAISEAARTAVADILTDDQKATFAAVYEETGEFRQAIQAVELTAQQRDEVRAVLQDYREDLADILTEEQKDELRSLIMERRRPRRR